MRSSGAAIVKEYLEKYVFINQFKTKKNRYLNRQIARDSLSIAYDIIHEMDYLIFSNNANNFGKIRNCLHQKVQDMHSILKKRQSFLKNLVIKTTLPMDFSQCIKEAWFKLKEFEKNKIDQE